MFIFKVAAIKFGLLRLLRLLKVLLGENQPDADLQNCCCRGMVVQAALLLCFLRSINGREWFKKGDTCVTCEATNSANFKFSIQITCSRDLREIRLTSRGERSAGWRRRGCFVTLLSPSLTLTSGAASLCRMRFSANVAEIF